MTCPAALVTVATLPRRITSYNVCYTKLLRFYDEYNAVLDLPAEYYIDTVKTVFQEFALPKGRMFSYNFV